MPCNLSADQCASSYAEKLSDLLEKHAPETKKVLTIKSFSPWITDEVHDAIRLRRCAERNWRHTHLTIHQEIYKYHRTRVTKIIAGAKRIHFNQKISESSTRPKDLFSTVDKLLCGERVCPSPTQYPADSLADKFAEFFHNKITVILVILLSLQRTLLLMYL